MLIVDNVLVSDEIKEKHFVCHLHKCKGACCVEGDSGAPLNKDELPILEAILPAVMPYLSEAGKAEIEKQGSYIIDEDADYATPIIDGKECVYSFYDQENILKCGIEQAYLNKKITFKKPISCHLYPIRITRIKTMEAVNYHTWEICQDACSLGEQLKIPLYKFLREPLIRNYGNAWYQKLVSTLENPAKP